MYFAFEDEDLDKVLADIKRNDAAGQPATATTGGLVYGYMLTIAPWFSRIKAVEIM